MEQKARVRQVYEDGTALVDHVRQSACSGDCHRCGGCGAVTETVSVIAQNPQGAQPGEAVLLRSDSRSILLAALVMYAVPLVLFFTGYLLGAALWDAGGPVGSGAFALGVAAAVVYDRRTAKKGASGHTVIRYPQTIDKGDN